LKAAIHGDEEPLPAPKKLVKESRRAAELEDIPKAEIE